MNIFNRTDNQTDNIDKTYFSDAPAHKKRKILTRLIVMALVLITIFGVTAYAWYIRNTKVSGEHGDVTTDETTLVVGDYQVLGYEDLGANALNRYAFYSDVFGADAKKVTMAPLDTMGINNEHTPLVIRIPVTGKLVKELGQALQVSISLKEDPAKPWVSDGVLMAELLSNIVKIKAVVGDFSGTDEEIWTLATKKSGTEQSFVNWNDTAPTKDSALSFTISGYDLPEDEPLNIYLVIDYNIDLVEQYILHKHISAKIGQTTAVQFLNDFAEITVDG